MWLNRAFASLLLVSAVCVCVGRAEYIWNGHDWVWKEDPAETAVSSSSNTIDEGSGSSEAYDGSDDEDDNWGRNRYEEGSGDYGEPEEDNNQGRGKKRKNNKKNKDGDRNKDRGRQNSNSDNDWDDRRVQEEDSPWNTNSYPIDGPNTFNPVPDNSDDIYVEGPARMPDIPPSETPERYPTNNHDIDNNIIDDRNSKYNNYNRPPINKSQSASFFAQPGTLAAVFGGAVVGLLCAILCVMFVVYRMRKKDEGSYMACDSLSKRSNTNASYSKQPREFFA